MLQIITVLDEVWGDPKTGCGGSEQSSMNVDVQRKGFLPWTSGVWPINRLEHSHGSKMCWCTAWWQSKGIPGKNGAVKDFPPPGFHQRADPETTYLRLAIQPDEWWSPTRDQNHIISLWLLYTNLHVLLSAVASKGTADRYASSARFSLNAFGCPLVCHLPSTWYLPLTLVWRTSTIEHHSRKETHTVVDRNNLGSSVRPCITSLVPDAERRLWKEKLTVGAIRPSKDGIVRGFFSVLVVESHSRADNTIWTPQGQHSRPSQDWRKT